MNNPLDPKTWNIRPIAFIRIQEYDIVVQKNSGSYISATPFEIMMYAKGYDLGGMFTKSENEIGITGEVLDISDGNKYYSALKEYNVYLINSKTGEKKHLIAVPKK
jgi:hypothetical protein